MGIGILRILLVILVWCLILFILLSYSIFYLPLLYLHNKLAFSSNITILIVTVGLMAISYWRGFWTNPGNPEHNFSYQYGSRDLQNLKNRSKILEEKKRLHRKMRKIQLNKQQIDQLCEITYCFKCQSVKQARTHHCSLCDTCVLRMDHHCPWIGNCVGKYNHKFFILFLLYATLGLTLIWLTLLLDLTKQHGLISKLNSPLNLLLIVVMVCSILLWISIGLLFITQIQTSYHNLTTLESFIPMIQDYNPFNKGNWVDNLAQIFGQNCWLLPTDPFSDEYRVGSI